LLGAMHRNQADFTLTFRALCDAAEHHAATAHRAEPPPADAPAAALFDHSRDYDDWAQRWRSRLSRESTLATARAQSMRQVNPAYIPRNHRIEQMIVAAVEHGDLTPFEEFSAVLSQPYRDQAAFSSYANPPKSSERVLRTFCGT
jgi:uncharacterized protein YdiU (UPF0061 family)